MKRTKRIISVALACLLAITMFAACGQSQSQASAGSQTPADNQPSQAPANNQAESQASASADPYTIHVISHLAPDNVNDYGYVFSRILNDYVAENPNFSFNYEVVAQMEIPAKISLLIAADDVPDFFTTEAGGSLTPIIESGAIANTEELLQDFGYKIEDFVLPSALEGMKVLNGTPNYWLPTRYAFEGIWYNKEIYAAHGLDVPETWEEMLAGWDTLKAAGIQPLAVAGQMQWPITRLMMISMTRYLGGNAVIDASLNNNGVAFTDDGYAEGARRMEQLFTGGYAGQGWNSIDWITAMSMFTTGEAAAIYSSGTIIPNFLNPEFNKIGTDAIGVFAPPSFSDAIGDRNGSTTSAIALGQSLCFGLKKYNEGTNNGAIAALLENIGQYMWDLGSYSPYNVKAPDDLNPFFNDVMAYYDTIEHINLWFEGALLGPAATAAFQETQLLSESVITPEQYVENMAKAVEETR